MCDLTKQNFHLELATIERVIQRAAFIAIDTEFSGLSISSGVNYSLFDTAEERYQHLKLSVTSFAPLQFGLSIFVKDEKANSYVVYAYNTHLFPVSYGDFDTRFLSQVSSIKFLKKHNFDFNKMFYDGLPYLNETQAVELQTFLDSGEDLIDRISQMEVADEIQRKCSIVNEWLIHDERNSTVIHLDSDELSISPSIIHRVLRTRFPSIWTYETKFGDIVVEKVNKEKRKLLEQENTQYTKADNCKLTEELMGFTLVFRMLVKYQKPLIGHNMLLDLLYLYDKFYDFLPAHYHTFKADIHRLFPVVCDTKHLVYNLRKALPKLGLTETSNLSHVFDVFQGSKGRHMVLNSPEILFAESHDTYKAKVKPHEAGFDAYACGYVFLRLAHIMKFKDTPVSEIKPCDFSEYMQPFATFVNQVNLSRASIMYINLAGKDPQSFRPQKLFLTVKNPPMSSDELSGLLSSFGTVDIKMTGVLTAIVATPSFRCFKDILRNFKQHERISVVPYNKWKHSPRIKFALGIGAVLWIGVCASTLFICYKSKS